MVVLFNLTIVQNSYLLIPGDSSVPAASPATPADGLGCL